MKIPLKQKIVGSALWAAYGDALGFITELATEAEVTKRAGVPRVTTPSPTVRRVGGRFGAHANLPAGMYSDDTQLRLAVCRAIAGDGSFDVEAFTKVELPVWRSYALGAGRGTKAAARNLSKADVRWFSNFFGKGAEYVQGGGNGAAMRIQPHAWLGAAGARDDLIVLDVVRNSISTHGHMRGLLGAVFHALCLTDALREGRVPGPADWQRIARRLATVLGLMHEDEQISSIWLPAWEEHSRVRLQLAIDHVRREFSAILSEITKIPDALSAYDYVLDVVGGREPKTRGSGMGSAIAASALAFLGRGDPEAALVRAANTLGSDTDTIGTMAGALLGAVTEERPPGPLVDAAYIEQEAARLADIGMGAARSTFAYPDAVTWMAPTTELDAIGRANGTLALAGVGFLADLAEPHEARTEAVWQLFELDFGQTILAKRRHMPGDLGREAWPVRVAEKAVAPEASKSGRRAPPAKQAPLFDARTIPSATQSMATQRQPERDRRGIDELTTEAIRSGFDPHIVGRHIIALANGGGIEEVVAYTAIIAKALKARARSR